MKTKAAVCYEYGKPLQIEEVDLDKPKENEVLIKYEATGVCHTDLSVVRGIIKAPPLPAIIGHEAAGVIQEVGINVRSVKPGDHVAVLWVPTPCGQCYYCLKGHPHLCIDKDKARGGKMLDGTYRLRKGEKTINVTMATGTFCEYNVLSERSVLAIDRDIPFDVASLVGCAVITGMGAVWKAKVEAGSSVAVIGTGGVGLNIIQGAVLANATTIIAIDILDNKLDIAKEFGATHVINSSKEDPAVKVMEITGGIGADYSFEAIGKSQTVATAFKLIRRGGTTVTCGIPSLDDCLNLPLFEFPFNAKTFLGSYYGGGDARVQIPLILNLYKQGRIKLNELITKRYRFEEINTAFADLSSGKNARGVVIF